MRKLINIGNKNIEYIDKGKGNKTVVIQTGMACPMYDWLDIIDEISKHSRVIIFHRSGCGQSEVGNEKRTTAETVEELNLLIEKLEITKPVILVGHSYGGLCTQHFVKKYPNKVAGVVLVDSASVDSYKFNELELPISDEKYSNDALLKKWNRYSHMSTEELKEEVKPKLSSKQLKLSKEIQNELLNFYVNPNLYKALASELENWDDSCLDVKDIGEFPNIPLKVLLRDGEFSIKSTVEEDGIPESEARKIEELWQELVKEQSKLSDKSELIIAEGSGHCIYVNRPDVIIDAIEFNGEVTSHSF